MNNTPQKDEEEKVKEAVVAFDDFMSTMDDLSKTQQTVINETNRQLELEKIETLKKQINEEK
ncbi:MAG: hypothetical protein COS72_01220 [Candidatus Moranbacteria bacterium CG06_land_8_20_14_3_00_43_56]|nr:MAG: hypothetical protein COS72_01220 [Candidatus Moranbacteria bacterium CG06_land_8_20_14_3_00_43_56]